MPTQPTVSSPPASVEIEILWAAPKPGAFPELPPDTTPIGPGLNDGELLLDGTPPMENEDPPGELRLHHRHLPR